MGMKKKGFFHKLRDSSRTRRSVKLWRSRARKIVLVTALAGVTIWLVAIGWVSNSYSRAWHWTEQKVYTRTAALGFRVDDILVDGRVNTPAQELLAKLGIRQGQSIFSVDLDQAQRNLETIPWIDHAYIARRLPDKIYIRLKERTPIALWQFRKQLSVIDQDGIVLTDHDLDRFKSLPMVVGEDAPQHVAELVGLLNAEPEIAHYLEAAVRVGHRRWNLQLKNHLLVKLPEKNVELALRRLVLAQQQQGLFDKNISVVDLRLPDRMVVEPAGKADDKSARG